MFSRSSSHGASRKSSSRPRKSLRQLALEPLEDRSLLSVTLGLPLGAIVDSASAVHGPIVPGHGGDNTAAASQLVMHLPAQVPNGAPVTVELTALDNSNRRALEYSGTITLSSSDPKITLPQTVTFNHGIAVFAVTFNSTGAQTLTASDSSTPPLTVAANTTVAAPLVATKLLLRVPEDATSSVPVTVKLGAVDAQNHLVPNYSGTITLTSSDPHVTLPQTITFDHGVAEFQVTFNTDGAQTLTATDNSATPLSVTANTTVVAPVVPTKLVMRLPDSAESGRPVTVELKAEDINNNLDKNYSGTITLTSNDANIVLPKTITFRRGIAIFQVTFGTVGSESLTATDDSSPPLTVTMATNVAAPKVPLGGKTDHSSRR